MANNMFSFVFMYIGWFQSLAAALEVHGDLYLHWQRLVDFIEYWEAKGGITLKSKASFSDLKDRATVIVMLFPGSSFCFASLNF